MKNTNLTTGMSKTYKLVLTAILFAFALVLSLAENALPPVPVPVPGVKLGLSNIVVMFSLFFVGKSQAFSIAVLKAIFVFLTRGFTASFLSLCGGVLSLIIMLLLILTFKEKISYLMLSIFGAVFHNIGQFFAISFLYSTMSLWAYIPLLIISGILAGITTSVLLKLVLPAFKKVSLNKR